MNAPVCQASVAFGGPGRYLQGPGILGDFRAVAEGLGDRPLFLIDAALFDPLRARLSQALGAHAAAARFERFGGECTDAAIASTAAAARQHRAGLIIGVGGGKTIDTAKGARIEQGVPLVIMPTIASNDSPTSRLVVVYDAAHRLLGTRLMRNSPDLVLVDTELIARAPRRFLLAGMGDAISKRFEAEQAIGAGGRNFFGGAGGQTALAIARNCYRIIREDAVAALAAADRQTSDAAFERMVETCVLGSGLGFESGGLSIAHSLLRGFSEVPSLAHALHGEQVAVGLLVQLAAQTSPSVDLDELQCFYRQIGLPCRLEDLGLDVPIESVAAAIVQRTVRNSPYIAHFERPVSEARLLAALMSLHR